MNEKGNAQHNSITVVGGGFAGSECAYQLAQRGWNVTLVEMRPLKLTPAHHTGSLAELVCSNSFGSQAETSATGQLKWEAAQLDSLILKTAKQFAVPAGQALAVDREAFAVAISEAIKNHPRITVENRVIESLDDIPRPAVIATGPLTDSALANSMREHFGGEFLYFFDAIAPIVDADSINYDIVWRADRYDKGTPDYLNCPMDKDQYYSFMREILAAQKIEPKDFEKDTPYFESCMPIEAMVERGINTPRFGPMKPKGLKNPRTGREPYAVVQLRQDNRQGTAYNIVGFQTKMSYSEQKRVFSMIPGLENAEFLKLGSMHRNLYINTPKTLHRDLSSRKDDDLFFAGQITGVEGYFESTCIGMLVALFMDQRYTGKPFIPPPRETAFGSLLTTITDAYRENFQPMNINFGLMPPVEAGASLSKSEKRVLQLKRAKDAALTWTQSLSGPSQKMPRADLLVTTEPSAQI
jgi:methylenetetrahydrofolate--tRNA-(uracil-5-)-methyltransferase